MQRASQVARQEQAYLLMGIAKVRLGAPRPVEPKTVLIDPSGAVVFTCIKNRLVPGFEANAMRTGDGRIRTAATPWGRCMREWPHIERSRTAFPWCVPPAGASQARWIRTGVPSRRWMSSPLSSA